MKNLIWIFKKKGICPEWTTEYRNRHTKKINKFTIMRLDYGYWLVWDTPIENKGVNTFRRLKNAKMVAQLIAFG